MDNGTLALLIPIAALAIPTAAIVMNGMQKLARLRIEEAKARARSGGDEGEVAALRDEVAALRHELVDLQERLDFTERVLTRGREAGQ